MDSNYLHVLPHFKASTANFEAQYTPRLIYFFPLAVETNVDDMT
jgi:hypothetical protein